MGRTRSIAPQHTLQPIPARSQSRVCYTCMYGTLEGLDATIIEKPNEQQSAFSIACHPDGPRSICWNTTVTTDARARARARAAARCCRLVCVRKFISITLSWAHSRVD